MKWNARIARLVTAALLLLAAALVPAAAGGRWLHVRVNDGEDRVSINVPLEFVASLLPMIEAESLEDGKLSLGDEELEGVNLRQVLAALRDTPDGDFVTVDGPEQSVRVGKERGFLLVRAEGDGERLRVRLPLPVVEAMLGNGASDELDLAAGLRALERFNGPDLVTVESDDNHVRIWIDASESGS